MNMVELVVLISGNGSNLQALIDATERPDGALHGLARIRLVISNRSQAYGLERARNHGIEAVCMTLRSFPSRVDYDIGIAHLIKEKVPAGSRAIIVLAGWMHILSLQFLQEVCRDGERAPFIIINLHPALKGMFDGARAIERAFEAFQQGKISHTGVMVHHVVEAVDQGDVIVDQVVPIEKNDTLETVERKIHEIEHGLIVEAVRRLCVVE